jgi:hypothetical protein
MSCDYIVCFPRVSDCFCLACLTLFGSPLLHHLRPSPIHKHTPTRTLTEAHTHTHTHTHTHANAHTQAESSLTCASTLLDDDNLLHSSRSMPNSISPMPQTVHSFVPFHTADEQPLLLHS